MAYNILKGTVAGSVDQHADQKIDGVKIFKNTISASVFYDTDAQSPCATLKDVAIKKINGGAQNGILILDQNSSVKTHHTLKFDKDTLFAKTVKAETIVGSAKKMTNIPCDKFTGLIGAKFLSLGDGVSNTRDVLQVKASDGIKTDETGVSIDIAPASCLSIINNKLTVNPTKATKINTAGQNLSEDDLFMVYDISKSEIANTTLKNIFTSFVNPRVPHAHGRAGNIQIKGKTEFESCDSLRYENKNKTLSVDGRIVAENFVSQLKTINEGAVYHNITTVSDGQYDVASTDYTVVCDASENKVIVKLPPAHNNKGRVLNIKKSNKDKYKLNSNIVRVICDEGRIDINNEVDIKMNFSCRTFQSDGENWLIIGSKGS